jgi:large subunit ribosomal protein L18
MKRRLNTSRVIRHQRVRTKVRGSATRPRLAVFRSLLHIYAQLIDDTTGRTLMTASDMKLKVPVNAANRKSAAARAVGLALAKQAQAAGLTEVVFDRGGYLYHGRVKAVADGAREGGLVF